MRPQHEAVELLADVLQSDVAAIARTDVDAAGADGPDLTIRFHDGTTLPIVVETAAHPSPAQVDRLVRAGGPPWPTAGLRVLVADALSTVSRQALAEAGWGFLDRRGRLYLNDGHHMIEIDVPRRLQGEAAHPVGIRGASGMTVAFAHLLEPHTPLGVRELTRTTRLKSPASVSNARRALQAANLLDPDGVAVLPDLFWALAAHWPRRLHGLAAVPTPEDLAERGQNINGPYFTNLEHLGRSDVDASTFEGVAVAGDRAAELYGFALVRGAEGPVDVYVPGEVVISRLERQYGEARHLAERAAGVATFPVGLAGRIRCPARPGSLGLPLAHPLVVALDLAQDPARGREILEASEPHGVHRVW